MPKYDVTITFELDGIEAADEEAARVICDEDIPPSFDHPTTGEQVFSTITVKQQSE